MKLRLTPGPIPRDRFTNDVGKHLGIRLPESIKFSNMALEEGLVIKVSRSEI
jgi:hypothetical protein